MTGTETFQSDVPRRVLVFGATGTAGRGAVRALVEQGHNVVCFVRPGHGSDNICDGIELRFGDVTDPGSIAGKGFANERFDAVVSCLASRTGAPQDAWAVDHQAHLNILNAAKAVGVSQFVLLSAICVQKPELPFQRAKLAFEKALIESGLDYSIVRPTAFFKSLSGQIDRVRRGKPFLLFGDGALTACKPISDDDLGRFIATCLRDPACRNRILPIGGPGPAITPKEQGDQLFHLLGQPPKFRSVPVGLLSLIYRVLRIGGTFSRRLAEKAELARIGRYYATESMLVLDPESGRYEAAATPSTGKDTLFDFYATVIADQTTVSRGEHSVF